MTTSTERGREHGVDHGRARLRALSVTWQRDAACRGTSVEPFFPQAGEPSPIAEALCSACPVRVRCLAYAIAAGERFGIWGGLTPKERNALADDERARIMRRAARAA